MVSRFATASLAAALAAAIPAYAISEPSGLAPRLRAPAGEVPAFVLSGNGVIVYQCKATVSNPYQYSWYFIAPDATLYNGSHEVARMAQPNLLEALSDDTSVSGILRASQPASGSLPWTLAQAVPMGDSGIFAGVTSFQRVNTQGGLAPNTGCSADNVGQEARVAFNANYYFYKRRGT